MIGNRWIGEFWENKNLEIGIGNLNQPNINLKTTTLIYRSTVLHRKKPNSPNTPNNAQ